jgi:hypothetical protein
MQSKSVFEISYADTLRFRRIVMDVMSEACNADSEYEGIGTLAEKQMHAAIKRFVCPDESKHEIKLDAPRSDEEKRTGRRRFVADILDGNTVYEIQTGSFYSLKPKLRFYLEQTDYIVTVVHPIAGIKYLSWIDTEDGSVRSRRRSPKKGSVLDALPELYWISDMLDNERLHFCFPILEIDEFRLLDGWSRDKKRGSNRFERIPTELMDLECVAARQVRSLLPEGLPEEFTSRELSRLSGFKGRKLYNALSLLCSVGAVERGEKKGKSFVYHIVT